VGLWREIMKFEIRYTLTNGAIRKAPVMNNSFYDVVDELKKADWFIINENNCISMINKDQVKEIEISEVIQNDE
jgi:hypothetical protein